MEDASTRTIQFKKNLKYWVNFGKNNPNYKAQCSELSEKSSSGINTRMFEKFINNLQFLETCSKSIIRDFADFRFDSETAIELIDDFNSVLAEFKQNRFDRITANTSLITIVYVLYDVSRSLKRIAETEKENPKFSKISVLFIYANLFLVINYTYEADDETLKALQTYTERGLLNNSDRGYSKSPIGQLEKFVLDKPISIREYFGNDSIMNESDGFERMFYAIVAPSMEGKTQTPFTFKKLRSLYFLLTDYPLSKLGDIQQIYKNFIPLSEKLNECALLDLELIKNSRSKSKENISFNSQVSAIKLLDFHSDVKFHCLGFVAALIENANLEFERSGLKWMEFFAKAPRRLSFYGLSLNDMKKFDFGRYVAFFDEFQEMDWTVFVRNLFRAVSLSVFVANNNTSAANSAEVSQCAGFSRIEPSYVWSLVSVRLNSINKKILHGMSPGLSGAVTLLVEKSKEEGELVNGFFNDFMETQLKRLRPGFADLICAAITEVSSAQDITLNVILQAIISKLSASLVAKKPLMVQDILGTLALFMNNTYRSDGIAAEDEILHLKSYLQDHFFYLVNPLNAKNWCFLACPPLNLGPSSSSHMHLRYVIPQSETVRKKYVDWNVERTFFKKEEVLPLLSCQSIFNQKSISSSLKEGIEKVIASFENTENVLNTSQKSSLRRNYYIEVLSSICIIEASQHDIGSESSTFTGQKGKSFLTNLIANLIEANGFRRSTQVKLNCEIIESTIKTIHVPFLFPAGMELPSFFKKNLSGTVGFKNRSVNFGEFKRTTNSTQIDGSFNFFVDDNSRFNPLMGLCLIEYKTWKTNVLANHLTPILEKALKKYAKLSLIFCNSLGSSKAETLNPFVTYCKDKKLNALKLEKSIGDKNFKLISFCPDLKVDKNAEMVCIIIELKVINS